MGFLKALKRWIDQRDAYDQITTYNHTSPFVSADKIAAATKPMYRDLDPASSEPSEGLEDADLHSHRSQEALVSRNEAVERERQRRGLGRRKGGR